MFAKIFNQIYDSTIAGDYQVRHVFMDLIVLADSDGVIDMPLESISRRTNMPMELVKTCIEKLEAPDPQSRTPEHEGRRIERISDREWGWQIINYLKYRAMASELERRSHGRERAARHRTKTAEEIGAQRGYVYYATVPKSGQIKIGFSQNPWARMKEFATARPGIRVVATERTTLTTERKRHEEFSILHIGGEWFEDKEPLSSFVQSLMPSDLQSVVTTSLLRSNDSSSASSSESKKKEKKESPNLVPTAEDIYNAYPLKVGKPEALRAIKRQLGKYGGCLLLERALAFAKARSGNMDFCPNPSTWFNQERFNDDPSTWKRNNGAHSKTPTPSSRNVGTANEGNSSQYAGVGKLQSV